MTLIVEDGTGVLNANSYVTLIEIRAYATDRGIILNTTEDSDIEAFSQLAIDFLESLRRMYKGEKTDNDNSLQWPRRDVFIDNFLIDSDVIPTELQQAQSQLIVELDSGEVLSPTLEPGFVLKEEIANAISTTFSDKLRTSGEATFTKVDELLRELLTGSSIFTTALRI